MTWRRRSESEGEEERGRGGEESGHVSCESGVGSSSRAIERGGESI